MYLDAPVYIWGVQAHMACLTGAGGADQIILLNMPTRTATFLAGIMEVSVLRSCVCPWAPPCSTVDLTMQLSRPERPCFYPGLSY
jgi:hypothetical protein